MENNSTQLEEFNSFLKIIAESKVSFRRKIVIINQYIKNLMTTPK